MGGELREEGIVSMGEIDRQEDWCRETREEWRLVSSWPLEYDVGEEGSEKHLVEV